MKRTMADDRRAAKQSVLTKVNTVLAHKGAIQVGKLQALLDANEHRQPA